jgi:predicted MFS family arabinose efflux permease
MKRLYRMGFGINSKSFHYKANKQIWMFLCYTFLNYLALAAFYNVLISIYYKTLGFQEDFIGNVIAVRTLLVGLGSIPAGMLAHRLGRRNAIIAGIIMSGAGYIGLLFFRNYPVILFSAAINGLGTATSFVNDAPLLSENCDDEMRIDALSLNFIAVNIAYIVGSHFAGLLPELLQYPAEVSIKYTLLGFTAIQLVSFIPLLKLANEKGARGGIAVSSYFSLLKRKKLQYILFYNMFVGIGSGLIIPFFSLYLVHKFNVGTSEAGFIMACSQAATIIGSAFVPYLSRRFSNMAIVLFCIVLSVPFLLTITVSGSILII